MCAAIDADTSDVTGDRLHVKAIEFAASACPDDPGTAQRHDGGAPLLIEASVERDAVDA